MRWGQPFEFPPPKLFYHKCYTISTMVHQNELTQSDNISSFAREHVHKE